MYDDSTGKHKASNVRTRSALLSTVFIIGICLGIMISERLYLSAQEGDRDDSDSGTAAARSRKLELSSSNSKAITKKSSSSGGAGGFFGFGAKKQEEQPGPRNELEALLLELAPEKEVMIVISNFNLINERSLVYWLQCADKIESKNWLVVAIDEELRDYCLDKGINVYFRPVVIPKTQENAGSNHAISAMKYEIVEEFLVLGWNVLLSDVDIVMVQDPFKHLHRDSDVEGMSDGFDDVTAYGAIYGVDDPTMGWSRYAQGVRHMVLNSGLFYLQASPRTIELMQRIASRLKKEQAWDQSVYNEEIFFLSHGDYKSPQVSVRVMDIMKFMNSKTLFKNVRNLPRKQQPTPVMVHMNYHPDKTQRMEAAIKYYLEGDANALKPFPGGSEPGTK